MSPIFYHPSAPYKSIYERGCLRSGDLRAIIEIWQECPGRARERESDMNEIFRRVSIRKYQDRPVEREKIEAVLRAAMAAPSAGNQQPWEFIVVTNGKLIEELSKVSRYSGCAAGAPAVIVPCMKTEGLKYPPYGIVDLSIATENILLEIVSQGLGGVWLGIAPQEERIAAVDGILGIGEGLHAFALVPVGYPAEEKLQQDRYEESRICWMQ